MNNLQSIQEELSQLENLKSLVETYESIAVIFVRRIRQSVFNNRSFYAGLTNIYTDVIRSYHEEVKNLAHKQDPKTKARFTLLRRNGKTVAVLLSANIGLYGNIIHDTFKLFLDYVKNSRCDILVIGTVGKALLEKALPSRKFEYAPYPDIDADMDHFRSITQYLERYEDVVVFFGEFRSFLSLKAQQRNISGELEVKPTGSKTDSFLFEPSLEQVVIFFETEIFVAILKQLFYESRLAKLASRMFLLDQANTNINNTLRKTSLTEQKLRHQIVNKRQLEIVSSIMAHRL